jgi:hypothetical protein
MLNKVEKTTIKGVINWYSSQNIPNYTILHKTGKNVKYSYSGGDHEEGLNTLNCYLNDMVGDENHNNTFDYFLRLDDNSRSKNKEERSLLFNLTGEHKSNISGVPMIYQNTSSNLSESKIAEIIRKELEERDRQLEAEEIDEEIENIEPQGIGGMIGQIIQGNPELQTSLSTLLIAGINGLSKMFVPKNPVVTQISGINEKVEIKDILKELYSKGVTNDDLLLLSQKDQSTISMLLSMLRNNK